MMEAEYMAERTVGPAKRAHYIQRLPPVRAETAVRFGNAHRKKTTGTQCIPLRFWRSASRVAFGGG